MNPNFQTCQEWPHWDDVNGSWENIENVAECPYTNEEGDFDGEVYEEIQ